MLENADEVFELFRLTVKYVQEKEHCSEEEAIALLFERAREAEEYLTKRKNK